MSRPHGVGAISKLLIGLMIFVASFITATPSNVNIDNVELHVSPLNTQSTELEYQFTNNTAYAIGHTPDIVRLEQLTGDTWTEIPLDSEKLQFVYELLASSFLYDSILPGETFEHHIQLSLLFPDETAPAGTYRLTVEYKTQKMYSAKNISATAQTSCEFTVVEA